MRLMSVRVATTANDNKLTLPVDLHGMVGEILNTTSAMGCAPVAGMNSDRPGTLIDHATYAKAWSNHGSDSFAFFVDCVAIQEPGARPLRDVRQSQNQALTYASPQSCVLKRVPGRWIYVLP